MNTDGKGLVSNLPLELDIIKTGIGYTMHGWDFSHKVLAAAASQQQMLNPAIELGTNFCPWNCGFCFTEDPANPEGDKRRLLNEMSLERRLALIEECAALGVKSINFVGAGEPTIDPDFWTLIDKMHSCVITPIVYTEASLRLNDRVFVRRLHESGATVVVKANSLWNADYQNSIVAGPPNRKRPNSSNYTKTRNEAIDLLLEEGFASHDPTRLAFDTIICRQNIGEIIDLHRYTRKKNIFVLFVNYLPSGRSSETSDDALSREEQSTLFQQLAEIDAKEFGIVHDSRFPYAGGTPCTIRGFGLYIKIDGRVFDCPGESQALGHLKNDSLAALWGKVRPITESFDGGCFPRDQFWETHGAATDQKTHLTVLR